MRSGTLQLFSWIYGIIVKSRSLPAASAILFFQFSSNPIQPFPYAFIFAINNHRFEQLIQMCVVALRIFLKHIPAGTVNVIYAAGYLLDAVKWSAAHAGQTHSTVLFVHIPYNKQIATDKTGESCYTLRKRDFYGGTNRKENNVRSIRQTSVKFRANSGSFYLIPKFYKNLFFLSHHLLSVV